MVLVCAEQTVKLGVISKTFDLETFQFSSKNQKGVTKWNKE